MGNWSQEQRQQLGYAIIRWSFYGGIVFVVVAAVTLSGDLFTLSQWVGTVVVLGTLSFVTFITRGSK